MKKALLIYFLTLFVEIVSVKAETFLTPAGQIQPDKNKTFNAIVSQIKGKRREKLTDDSVFTIHLAKDNNSSEKILEQQSPSVQRMIDMGHLGEKSGLYLQSPYIGIIRNKDMRSWKAI